MKHTIINSLTDTIELAAVFNRVVSVNIAIPMQRNRGMAATSDHFVDSNKMVSVAGEGDTE